MESRTKSAMRNDRDRISKLPKPILHHILSFLGMRDVVRAGMLSRRWKNLWASMQCLSFDQSEFTRYRGHDNFEPFVNTTLLLRDALDLHTFRLIWSDGFNQEHANTWIRHAVKHKVKVLVLQVATDEDVEFPSCIFASESLEALHLPLPFLESGLIVPDLISLPRIKSLHIVGSYLRLESLEKLISGCPVLENLLLEDCSVDADEDTCVGISSQTLKSLSIKNWQFKVYKMRISLPSLVSLDFSIRGIEEISLENLSSLVNATVGYKDESETHRIGLIGSHHRDDSINHGSAFELISGLSNAKALKFYGRWIELVSEKLLNFPTFHNLKSLTLHMSDNLQIVVCFLRHSPNLETFTLCEEKPFLEKSYSCIIEPSRTSRETSFEWRHLKIVTIQCFKSKKSAHPFVEFLLSHAPILENVIILPR